MALRHTPLSVMYIITGRLVLEAGGSGASSVGLLKASAPSRAETMLHPRALVKIMNVTMGGVAREPRFTGDARCAGLKRRLA